MTRKIAFLFSVLLLRLFAAAQDNKVEMADSLRSNGKIYVVVAVIITIFAGIILYLIRLDRKLTKLEKNHHNS
jgi:preprotein translocase subunit YajC